MKDTDLIMKNCLIVNNFIFKQISKSLVHLNSNSLSTILICDY